MQWTADPSQPADARVIELADRRTALDALVDDITEHPGRCAVGGAFR
jgi:hypothetical protein